MCACVRACSCVHGARACVRTSARAGIRGAHGHGCVPWADPFTPARSHSRGDDPTRPHALGARLRLQMLEEFKGRSEPTFLVYRNGRLNATIRSANTPALEAAITANTPMLPGDDDIEVRARARSRIPVFGMSPCVRSPLCLPRRAGVWLTRSPHRCIHPRVRRRILHTSPGRRRRWPAARRRSDSSPRRSCAQSLSPRVRAELGRAR